MDTITSPSGDAYIAYSPISTNDLLLVHGRLASISTIAMALGSVPEAINGFPLVTINRPDAIEAIPTISSLVVSWFLSGYECGK